MEMTYSANFSELTFDEMLLIDGGDTVGAVQLFVSMIAIAVSPVVIVVNPPSGLVLLGTGLYYFSEGQRRISQ